MRAQAWLAAGVQVGVAIDHQQAQPGQILQDRAQRRQLAQAELTRPVGRYPRYHCGVFSPSQYVREGGIGGQHGCRPCPAGPQVMHVYRCAHAGHRALAGVHMLRMPELAPASRPYCVRKSAASGPAGHEA